LILPPKPRRLAASITASRQASGFTPRIGYDFYFAFNQVRQDLFDHRDEVARVTRFRIARVASMIDIGDLREIIKRPVVDRSAADLLDRSLKESPKSPARLRF
jgi:hypothetical protein